MTYTVVPATGTANQIVQLDATPPVRLSAGASGRLQTIVGSGLADINMATTHYLPLIRIPTNAVVHKLEICCDTAPTTSLTGSVGLAFSDGNDGTPNALKSTHKLSGGTCNIFSQSFFFYAAAITAYVGLWTDITFQNYTGNSAADGFYVPSASNLPLWQATQGSLNGVSKLGAATSGAAPGAFTSGVSDPGGFFDICFFSTTTGVNTAAVTVNLRCTYLETAQN